MCLILGKDQQNKSRRTHPTILHYALVYYILSKFPVWHFAGDMVLRCIRTKNIGIVVYYVTLIKRLVSSIRSLALFDVAPSYQHSRLHTNIERNSKQDQLKD